MDPNKTIQNENKLKFLQQFTESKSDNKYSWIITNAYFVQWLVELSSHKGLEFLKSDFVIEVAHESFLGAILVVHSDWKDIAVKEGKH